MKLDNRKLTCFIHSFIQNYALSTYCVSDNMLWAGIAMGSGEVECVPQKACIPVRETSIETNSHAPVGRAEARSSVQRGQGIFLRKCWQD